VNEVSKIQKRKRILIFIPARGGSKGIPGKNIVDLNGKPLIQYTLDTTNELLKNMIYDWIPFISTDDEKIVAICVSLGFDVPYKRPKALAGDRSAVLDAVWDVLNWLRQEKSVIPDSVLLLQPTSPLRNAYNIFEAINTVGEDTDFSIVSVTRMREHPFECVELKNDGWTYLRKTDKQVAGRQYYDSNFYFIDGSFYYASVGFLRKNQSFLVENETKFHVLDHFWPIDIDEKEDLVVAASLLADCDKH